jgi:predicted nucleotide-binding protein
MSEEEWISAAAALALLGMNYQDATRTICKRAHADLIKARAARFIRSGQPSDNVDVPSEFWWAEGERALTQNWETGDFETWVNSGLIQLQAFGVTFRRSDIEKVIPTLETSAREAALERIDQRKRKMTATGKTVFIGHGRAAIWGELKDFLKDRLHLGVQEFNSVPVAGMTTTSRLKVMLDSVAFAFLIMTAEDEQPDGEVRARENVVHEAGLFQGRLGFEKAIILREEGCEEFSNIQGLNQIRFPKNKISSVFETIRQVLEREGLVPP